MHFTHVWNLPGILAAGCLRADNALRHEQAAVTEAADPAIKARRRKRMIDLAPFGCVADYVPFYFAPRSPMLFKLAKDGVPSYTAGRIRSSTWSRSRRILPGPDGACSVTATALPTSLEFYDDVRVLDTEVDWAIMRARMWNDTLADPDRMRRRMAEFLVHERVPVSGLAGIAVRSAVVREQVKAILSEHGVSLPVWVRRGWYF